MYSNQNQIQTNAQLLPPGHYIHSNQLVNTMNVTNPSYSVKFEPIFFEHLMLHLNKKIYVATVQEKLEGTLSGVAVDHLQLTIEGIDYHIRNEHVIYFRLAE